MEISSNGYVQTWLADLQRRMQERMEFEKMLLDAIRSPTVDADAAFWAERRRKSLEKSAALKECVQR